jgi:hypothetical protein
MEFLVTADQFHEAERVIDTIAGLGKTAIGIDDESFDALIGVMNRLDDQILRSPPPDLAAMLVKIRRIERNIGQGDAPTWFQALRQCVALVDGSPIVPPVGRVQWRYAPE